MLDVVTRFLPTLRDAFQTIFFISVSTVTILTYLKAKRTLLQPIRTEVFKEQLKAFTELLSFFTGKGEIGLRSEFAFEKFFQANACSLLDAYMRHFFDAEIDPDKRPYSTAECPRVIIASKHLELADEHVREDRTEPRPKPDPATRAAIWSQYEFSPIRIPKEMIEAEERLVRMLESPLLPKQCVKLGEEFLEGVRKNTMRIGPLLTQLAKELPSKYPNRDTLKKASFSWIRNSYNEKFEHLDPKAKEITDFLRKYYLTDELLEV